MKRYFGSIYFEFEVPDDDQSDAVARGVNESIRTDVTQRSEVLWAEAEPVEEHEE